MEIKINQPKNNRYRIDYNLDIIKVIEKYLDENKIKYVNKIENGQYLDENKLKKEDIHSTFKDEKKIYVVLNNGEVVEFKSNDKM